MDFRQGERRYTNMVLQHNPGFNFTVSCKGFSTRPSFRDTPGTFLASVTVLRLRGNVYDLFLLSVMLKPEPCG